MRRRTRRLGIALAAAAAFGCGGGSHSAGTIEGAGRDPEQVAARAAAQDAARRAVAARAGAGRAVAADGTAEPVEGASRQILFGDLHVHTTFSIDAFLYSLPVFAGEGAHPPADACDFARYCAELDFFSLNDHAESLFPARWQESIESVRACNARAGDPASPDLVAYVGYEWTQAGSTPETHYGHRNVVFRGLGEDEIAPRPITSLPDGTMQRAPATWMLGALERLMRPVGLDAYADFVWLIERLVETPDCERGVDTRRLPPDCRENASTPAELFEKLAQGGWDTLVIPHGLAWGIHAPPGARLDDQLAGRQHDPGRQRLLEVFSGHGNSEEWRDFPEYATDASGERICPEPTEDYLPCCWRAGEIMRERCGDLPAAECEARVEEARRLALAAGTSPHHVFPDAPADAWLDCDQCRDCFKPALTLRPRETAQYGAAISDFEREEDGRPGRFRWGFIASSDNHSARAGSGYKQVERPFMTDARGIASPLAERFLRPYALGRSDDPQRPQPVPVSGQRGMAGLFDVERSASFLYPGGLVAVHADGRDRDAIWEGLWRREVYGTSGPRILLWFDLMDPAGGRAPMGSEVDRAETPRFEVRAVGSFVQRPGCPAESEHALSPERLERLCRGECYHPSDERHPIAAIEVVRIRPQARPGEAVDALIEDPWRRFPCEPDPAGCVVRFEDPDYVAARRDTVYYVRALQVPTPAINGANLRTAFDASGRAVGVTPCRAGYRGDPEDDCLAPVQERAWSSPIYLDWSDRATRSGAG
jgi:hypothetical protein